MARCLSILFGMCLLTVCPGCGSGKTDAPVAIPSTEIIPIPSEVTMMAEGMKLVMYDDTPNEEQVYNPTFIVHAASATALTSGGNDNHFKLTDPEAIIFTDDQEELNLHAASGVFDGKSDRATLDGGVKLFSSRLNLTMHSIVWDNTSRTGHTNEAVEFKSDSAESKASGMTLQPNTGQLILDNVTGILTLGASN